MNLPLCPHCQSRRVETDDPPPAGYALTVLGAGLLFAGAFLHPDLFDPRLEAFMASPPLQLLAVGLALAAYGGYRLFHHRNRYCADCGHRWRAPEPRPADARNPEIGGMAGAFLGGGSKASLDMPGGGPARSNGAHDAGLHDRARARRGVSTESGGAAGSAGAGARTGRVQPLLACLGFKDPRARAEAARTLRQMTGQDFGEDAAAWRAYFDQQRRGEGGSTLGSTAAEADAAGYAPEGDGPPSPNA